MDYGINRVELTRKVVAGDHPPITAGVAIASGQSLEAGAVLGRSRATGKYGPLAVETAVTDETVAAGTGALKTFEAVLANGGVVPGTLAIAATIGAAAVAMTDDGLGRLSGDDGWGFVDYASGYLRLTFTTAPDNATNLTASYAHDGGGQAVAVGVLLGPVDASGGETPGPMLAHGVALAGALTWPEDIEAEQKSRALAQLAAVGVYVRED